MRTLLSWLGYICVMFAIALNASSFVFKAIEHGRVVVDRGPLEVVIFYDALLFGASMVIFILAVIRIHTYSITPEPVKGKK